MTPHNGYRKNRRRMLHVFRIHRADLPADENVTRASERMAGEKGPTGLASRSEKIACIGGAFF